MLDLGFSKIALIGAVALIVIGPEKLPRVARMAGSLWGRAQRYLHQVKAEVSRDIELEELKNIQRSMADTSQAMHQAVRDQLKPFDEFSANSFFAADQALAQPLSGPSGPDFLDTPDPVPPATRIKIRQFHQRKIAKKNSIPLWYKNQQQYRQHVLSAAARVAKYQTRRTQSAPSSFYS